MEKFNKKLAVMILKNTTAYKVKHLFYTINSDRLVVWSSTSNKGQFLATEIIQFYSHPFSSYVKYNQEEGRCELHIF